MAKGGILILTRFMPRPAGDGLLSRRVLHWCCSEPGQVKELTGYQAAGRRGAALVLQWAVGRAHEPGV